MTRGPDVLFIKPGSQKQLYGSLSDYSLTAIEPPLWAAILGGFLRGQGYAVPGALLALAVAAVAAVTGFYIPETAQLPAGLLSLFGISLLLPSLREFAPAGDSDTAGT